MVLERAGQRRGWRLKFTRDAGPAPGAVEVPETLAGLHFTDARGSEVERRKGRVFLDPQKTAWEAAWS